MILMKKYQMPPTQKQENRTNFERAIREQKLQIRSNFEILIVIKLYNPQTTNEHFSTCRTTNSAQ